MFKVGDLVECTNSFGPYFPKGRRLKVVNVKFKGSHSTGEQWLGFIIPEYTFDSNVAKGEPNFGSSCFQLVKKQIKNLPTSDL